MAESGFSFSSHTLVRKDSKQIRATTNGEFKCQNLNFRMGSCSDFGVYELLSLNVEKTWSDAKMLKKYIYIFFELFTFMFRTFK